MLFNTRHLGIAALSVLIVACGGGPPTDTLVGHFEDLAALMETHKDDPSKATAVVEEYLASNRSGIETAGAAVEKEVTDLQKALESTPDKAEALKSGFSEKHKAFMSRMTALAGRMDVLFKDNPALADSDTLATVAKSVKKISRSMANALSADPLGPALDHQIAMLRIVEANKTDVAKATSELEAYIKTNEASIKKVNEDVEKMQTELKESKDMAKAMDMMKDHAARIQEVSELKNKLREEAKDVYGDEKVRELVRSVKGF